METLLPILLLVGLSLLALVPASWTRGLAERGAELGLGTAAAPSAADSDWEFFSPEFVRHRMGVLADELQRLEREPAFAKAFRTIVAMSALEALAADAARIAAVPSIDLDPHLRLALELDLDVDPSATRRREVLEL